MTTDNCLGRMQGYNCIMIFNAERTKVLMCQRVCDPYKGQYNLVGGKIEAGEDGFCAAYRELREETGIERGQTELFHMMDFTYYNQLNYVEVYVGMLKENVDVRSEKHPLVWMNLDEDFFDGNKFAGEGNIGHMLEQVRRFGVGMEDRNAVVYSD